MVDNVRAIAQVARNRYGVRAVIHPHADGNIEFADELERIAADVPADLAGLCLDTGHLDYSGMDRSRRSGATPTASTTSTLRTSTPRSTPT